MNFKKILSITSLLTVGLFTSLRIVACNINQTNSEANSTFDVNDIDKIHDLQIFISSEEENETVYKILNNPTLGIVSAISNYQGMNKNFKKELFKLDFENIYFDKSRVKKVIDKDKIIPNTTYYFRYSYKNKKNTILVPIKIIVDNKFLVIRKINQIDYKQDVYINTTINQLTKKLDCEFIKSKLDENIRKVFIDDLFKIDKITNLTDISLQESGIKKVILEYSYECIKNQKINLIINVISAQEIVNEIDNIEMFCSIKSGTKVANLQEIMENSKWIQSQLIDSKEFFILEDYRFIGFELENKMGEFVGLKDTDLEIGNREIIVKFQYFYSYICSRTTLRIFIK